MKRKVIVGKKGKITLPKEMLDAMNLKEGDTIKFEVEWFHQENPHKDYKGVVISKA